IIGTTANCSKGHADTMGTPSKKQPMRAMSPSGRTEAGKAGGNFLDLKINRLSWITSERLGTNRAPLRLYATPTRRFMPLSNQLGAAWHRSVSHDWSSRGGPGLVVLD